MRAGPLSQAPRVVAAAWPAAAQAGALLQMLGADVATGERPEPALSCGGVEVVAAPATADADWAMSHARTLTARAGGPALKPAGQPATLARSAALAYELLTGLAGRAVRIDGTDYLGERAWLLGFTGRGDQSTGGAAQIIRAADGWFALSLPRTEDYELIPALISSPSTAGWYAVRDWAADQPVTTIEARISLLGLAAGVLRPPAKAAPWIIRRLDGPASDRRCTRPLLVVNLGSLWAAPLCAHLLAGAGARVVDVESTRRPDGSRRGTPAFYRRLHDRHELAVFDLLSSAGRAKLRRLLTTADVVITASRHRALAALGVTPDQVPASRPRTWITVHGYRDDPDRAAFGDDAAVAGGLVAWDANGPVFAGDAIADPLTGLLAAVAAAACHYTGGNWQVAVSLRETASYAAALPDPQIKM